MHSEILRVFECFLWWEVFLESRESVVDAESDYIDYIVYGCSIVEENSENSEISEISENSEISEICENCEICESEMSQFWPYSAYPDFLRRHRRIIADGICE